MSIKIVKATTLDAVEMAYIKQNTWKACYPEILPRDYIDTETGFEQNYFNFQNTILRSVHSTYVVKFNNIIIGMLELLPGTEKDLEGNVCQLAYIYVLPDYWNKGFGKRIFRFIKKTVKAKKYDTLYLWNFRGNIRADYFFTECGFVTDGVVKSVDMGKGRFAEKYRMVRTDIQSQPCETKEADGE